MIEWFTRKPGGGLDISVEDPSLALLGNEVPDWVKLPAELGGVKVRVEGARIAPCAKCGGRCRHLKLAPVVLGRNVIGVAPVSVKVAECNNGCGFVWYKGGE